MNVIKKNALTLALCLSTGGALASTVNIPGIGEIPVTDRYTDYQAIGGNTDAVMGSRTSRYYYRIGSGPQPYPPRTTAEVRLRARAVVGLGYSCGNFDPKAMIDGLSWRQIKEQLQGVADVVEQGATAAVAALPMYALQRWNPGAYQLLQHFTVDLEEKFRFSTMSCREMEQRIQQGENPYKQFMEFGRYQTLQRESAASQNPLRVMDTVDRDGGKSGIALPMPGNGIQNQGGERQEPIRPTAISVVVGANILENRDTLQFTSTAEFVAPSGSKRAFNSPAEAVEFAQVAIGESEIYTFDGHPSPQSTPSKGIVELAVKSEPEIRAVLLKIVAEQDTVERASMLDDFNSKVGSGMLVTNDLIERIKMTGLEPIIVSQLSSQAALLLVIERALYVRRALIMSLSEPNISSSPMSVEVEKRIELLEREIDAAIFEYNLRKKVTGDLQNTIYDITDEINRTTSTRR
ncbi:MAG: hypothetical protein IBX55_10560 [Methyloprofundus sp.]|nr:hypothetical protein [Methyloprofundus sp.]